LAGADVVADLGDDHADDAVGRRAQDGLYGGDRGGDAR
jgi:hypothetical protein